MWCIVILFQIFNCGIGFVLILPETQAEEAISRIRAFHLPAWRIGEIARRERPDAGGAQDSDQVVVEFPG